MSPGAHLLFSWIPAAQFLGNRRERLIVSLCGIAPDLDGIGLIWDKIHGNTEYYFQYHHKLGHSLIFALVISGFAYLLASREKYKVLFISVVVIHVHIICDIVGSRGPDGYQWPIYYLYPFSSDFALAWSGQWELNAWENLLILILLLVGSMCYAKTKRISFLEIFSAKLDRALFNMLDKYGSRVIKK